MNRSTICITLVIVLFWVLVGCTPTQPLSLVTTTQFPAYQPVLTPNLLPISPNPFATSETPTPFTIPLSTTMPTPLPVHGLFTPTPTSTPTPVLMPVGSLLIYIEAEGIIEQPLPRGEPKILLSREPTWVKWKASLSPTGKYVAYWFENQTVSEVRIFIPDSQDSHFLANLSDVGFDEIRFEWLGSDRYLHVELRSKDSIGIMETQRVYLFDTQSSPMVVSDSIQFCPYLVSSLRTLQPAIVCPEQDNSGHYLVVEPFGEIWQSDETILGDLIIERDQGDDRWAWNSTGDRMVFTEFNPDGVFPGSLLTLYYMSLIDNSLQLLNDGRSSTFSTLSLSPDGQFIAYMGKCFSGFPCTLIMSIPSQEIIWNSRSTTTITPSLWISWSPDSHFFAVTPPLRGVIIFDVVHSLEVWHREDWVASQIIWR